MSATLLTAVSALLVATLVGVRGEFPLSDDASYAYAVKTLCTTGTLHFLPWTAPSLVLQAAYGAALCSLFGFSFTVLRVSTVVLATLGVVGFHQLLRELGVRGRPLAFGTALFALNPLYVNLAFTFMTDVPFTALVVWSGYAYVRALRERRLALLVWGGAAAAAGILVRQHGILIAVAAALACAAMPEWPVRRRLQAAVAALVLPVAVFLVFHLWLLGVTGIPQGYGSRLGQLGDVNLAGMINCGFRGLAYLGLFLVPLTCTLAGALLRSHRGHVIAWGGVLGVLAAALFVREGALMFYLTNVLYDLGLGALTLRDTLFLGYAPPLHLGLVLAVPLTVLALGGAALLGAAWTSAARRRDGGSTLFLQLAAGLLFAATLLQSRYYLDRHLLAVVPFAIAAVVAMHPVRTVPRSAMVLLVLLTWYAVAGTHDYLAWNRARFRGLDALLAQGVPATAIDGGVEFNAWYLSPTLGTWPSDREARTGQPASVRSWWWVVDDEYVASFRPLAGYRVVETLPFRRWLVPGAGEVLILRRAG